MTEKEITEFREKAISHLMPILLEDGYTHENNQASELAFFIAKILEDAYPLIKNIEKNESQTEKVINHIHLLYTNLDAFEKGKRLLMWGD